jgi:hypothetical protein
LDADWLDMPSLSQAWAGLVGQKFAICKVKDVRERDYRQEVCKYVVEGSELAKWPAEHVHEFVRAIKGRRFFFPFGTLFKMQPEIRKALRAHEKVTLPCECGCEDFQFHDEVSEIMATEKRRGSRNARTNVAHKSAQRTSCDDSPCNGAQPVLLSVAENTNGAFAH